MIGQLVLLFFVLLWLIAWAIEKALFPKPTRWWRSGLMSLGLLVLLHADAVVGYFVEYRPAVKEAGNGQVLKHVVADGFLDHNGSYIPLDIRKIEPGLVLFRKDYPFRYVEMLSAFASKSRLLASYGISNSAAWTYVHFYKGSAGSPECGRFDSLSDVAELRKKFGVPDSECLAAQQTREPISRYEVTESQNRKLNPRSPFLVTALEILLADRESKEPIARCRAIEIKPRISRIIFVQLVYDSHNPTCISREGMSSLITAAIASPIAASPTEL
jgi:hypothetical protein